MADDLVLNTGSGGGTVSADLVAGVYHQRVKTQFGGDGTAIDVDVNNPLPVLASGTVAVSGTPNVFVTNSGTVVPSGTQNVFVTNNGTVTANIGTGGTLLGAAGTVNVAGTPNVHVTNAATVTLTGTNPVYVTNNGTVTLTGTNPVFVTNNGTVTGGSVVVGQGWTLGTDFGMTAISLTATGTVIPAVTSKRIYVYSEAFTVQGGTVTVTVQQGAAGGTICGPRQFSPTGGIARSNPMQAPLYFAAAGSPVVFTLAGSGTVGGDIAWVANS